MTGLPIYQIRYISTQFYELRGARPSAEEAQKTFSSLNPELDCRIIPPFFEVTFDESRSRILTAEASNIRFSGHPFDKAGSCVLREVEVVAEVGVKKMGRPEKLDEDIQCAFVMALKNPPVGSGEDVGWFEFLKEMPFIGLEKIG